MLLKVMLLKTKKTVKFKTILHIIFTAWKSCIFCERRTYNKCIIKHRDIDIVTKINICTHVYEHKLET
jgi:hypothetical protein